MPEKNEKTATNRKMSRRDFLKYVGLMALVMVFAPVIYLAKRLLLLPLEQSEDGIFITPTSVSGTDRQIITPTSFHTSVRPGPEQVSPSSQTLSVTALPTPTAPPAVSPTTSPTALPTTLPTSTPTAIPYIKPSPTRPPAYLSVAQNGAPEELLIRAIEGVGGIRRFVRRGSIVVIKPNICMSGRSYEYAVTTNPWVVGTLVELCFQAGAREVLVFDYPFDGSGDQAYIDSGIGKQVAQAGGKMISVNPSDFVNLSLPNALMLRECAIHRAVLEADTVINVPIAKHHCLAGLTIGMKNLMGVILDRPALHDGLGQKLADLSGFIRPALTIVDATRILVANGPWGGNLDDVRETNTVIASPDIVAADSFVAKLFWKIDPNSLSYIQAGVEAGLGRNDFQNLNIVYT